MHAGLPLKHEMLEVQTRRVGRQQLILARCQVSPWESMSPMRSKLSFSCRSPSIGCRFSWPALAACLLEVH